MLLFAVLETWFVIWQPELGRHDLEVAVAKFFAFPYTVDIHRSWGLMNSEWLVIDIRFGPFQLFFFVSPLVSWYSAEWVFWFTQIRIVAFQIVFNFHLIALLLLMFILTSVDVIYRRFHVRAVTKHTRKMEKVNLVL